MQNRKFDISNHKLLAKYGKYGNILSTYFKAKKAQSKADIIKTIKTAQKIAKDKNQNFDFIVALKYDGNKWRNDKIFSVNEEPKLWLPEDHEISGYNDSIKNVKSQNNFNEFILYAVPTGAPTGGNSIYNDCLYSCLILGLGKDNLPSSIPTPARLKTKLGLDRKDKININLLSKVEDLAKVNINCSGDYNHISQNKYNYTININLKNGHYTLDKTKKKKYEVMTNSKKIGFYELVENGDYHLITDDFNKTIKHSEKHYLNKDYPEYMFLNKTKITSKKTLEQAFEEFKKGREDLFKETDGFIDLYKTPYFSQVAKRIIHYKCEFVNEPEELTTLESDWIYKCFRGALLYTKEGNYKDATCIDINSMYPYYMSHEKFLIPVKQGEFKTFENYYLKGIILFGIYRCKITTEKKEKHLFRFNELNYYTHYDINNARELGFDIEFIFDGQPNALIYSSEKRIFGSRAFGPAINYLFELKQKVKYTKNILSATWGFMMEKTMKKAIIPNDNNLDVLPIINDNFKIETIAYYNDCSKIEMFEKNNIYKSNWARIGPFLTAYCRYNLRRIITENNIKFENIIRIHTDSITTINTPINNNLIGDNIGQFKIEKQGDCEILNIRDIKWSN